MPRINNSDKTSRELMISYQQGDINARDILFEHYKSYAEKIAKNYYGLGIENEDILSAAHEGLLIILEELKSKPDVKNYNSYFNINILSSIAEEILANIMVKNINVSKTKIIHLLKQILRKDISEKEKLKYRKILKYLIKSENKLENLDIVKKGVIDTENIVISEMLFQEIIKIINESNLTVKQKYVLMHKYFIDFKTNKTLSSSLKVSISYINYLEKLSLSKIRVRCKKIFLDYADSLDKSSRADIKGLYYKRSNNGSNHK